jgi:3-phosphoshikimate 1-carboxyvinyltransferase
VTVRVEPAAAPLAGSVLVPGDKSIGHRAVMLAALADGATRITGLPDGADVMSTLGAVEALGARVERGAECVTVHGAGSEFAAGRVANVDCGNSGTTMRLLAGVVAARPGRITFDGDASLRARPMERVAAPLRARGAAVQTRDGRPPLLVAGAALRPQRWRAVVPSAQVKSAVLLAGLRTAGVTEVEEPIATRDHTERLLHYLGARVTHQGTSVRVEGGVPLAARPVSLPGDVSSAAFFLVAGAIVPGSEVLLPNVGVNPTRLGVIGLLRRMGADIELQHPRDESGEPRADLRIRGARLRGIAISAAEVPGAIDELPVLAMAAACAEGETSLEGAAELRVKESDRLTALEQLRALGGQIEISADGFRIRGSAGVPLAGGRVEAHDDHRIAMAFAILGLCTRRGVEIGGSGAVAVSFPGFFAALRALGATVQP